MTAQEFIASKQPVTKQVLQVDEEKSSVFTTLISLIIGAIVLISIPALIVYLVIHFRHADTTKPVQTASKTITTHITPSASPQTTVNLNTQGQSTSAQGTNAPVKSYSDTSGFQVMIPDTWRGFTRAVAGDAYQIAFGPQNSTDVPVTVSVVRNTQYAVTDWINTQYGANYPKQQQHIGNADAIMIQGNGQTSYFFSKNGTLYQLSMVVGAPNLQAAVSQIISSFHI